jgi:hypothetical protein
MISLSSIGSDHVIVGPHNDLVTRLMNDFGSFPGLATFVLRGTVTTVKLGPTPGVSDCLFAHYGGPGGGFAEVWYVCDLNGIISIPAPA